MIKNNIKNNIKTYNGNRFCIDIKQILFYNYIVKITNLFILKGKILIIKKQKYQY